MGPPKHFKKIITRHYKNLSEKSDYYFEKAINTLANYYRVDQENILIANGAEDIIDIIIRTLKPRKVLLPMPCDTMYMQACKRNGCEAVPFYNEKENEFDIIPDKLISAVRDADMIIISNPNNPTGRIIDKASMQKILDHCQQKGIYLVIDESYADFVPVDISSIRHITGYANIVIIRTPANYFALGGLQFAYCISCENLAGLLRMNQVPGTVNTIALLACDNLFNDTRFIKKTKAWLQTEPKRFYKAVSTLGAITAYKPYANYIFIELEQIPAYTLCERMEAKGIKVQNCSRMGILNGQYIRISIKNKKQNEFFLDRFSRCLL